MLGIFLGILKIIGIVILVILLTILVLLMIVLFVPIRYKVNATLDRIDFDSDNLDFENDVKDKIKFNATFSWLLHLVRGGIGYPKNTTFFLRVLFFGILPSSEEKKKKKRNRKLKKSKKKDKGNKENNDNEVDKDNTNTNKDVEECDSSDYYEHVHNKDLSKTQDKIKCNYNVTENGEDDNNEFLNLSENNKSKNCKSESDEPEKIESENIKSGNNESKNTESNYIESKNTESNSIESESIESENAKINHSKFDGIKTTESDDIGTTNNDSASSNTKMDDLKSDKSSEDEEDKDIYTLFDLFEKLADIFYAFADFLEKPGEACEKAFYTLSKAYDKIYMVSDTIENPIFDRAYERAKTDLFLILRHVMPKKAQADILLGVGDPCVTAQILAGVGVVNALCDYDIWMQPDFDNKLVEGKINIKGRVYLWRLALSVLRVYFNKDIRKVWKRFKRIIKK